MLRTSPSTGPSGPTERRSCPGGFSLSATPEPSRQVGTARPWGWCGVRSKPDLHLYALETRPYDQGARLTTFECSEDGIPCTLLADSMAAALMASGRVQSVVVGCDRVAANGDVANKIGTYSLAVLARHHGLPFYVAMPTSSLDTTCTDGDAITIEHRPPGELFQGLSGVDVWNPAFDVTPADLVTAWVSECGVSEHGPLP